MSRGKYRIAIEENLAQLMATAKQRRRKSRSAVEALATRGRLLDEQPVDHVRTGPESRARLTPSSASIEWYVLNRIFIAIIAFCAALPSAFAGDIELPDIGASADRLASPDEESRYGESMLREFRRLNLVMEDPLVVDYLRSLGYRLVAQSEHQADDFTFFVVRSDEINAFAAPGGYIAVNVGLMHTMETESELAAVLGHEIAHISQRHLVRAWESMQKASLPIALAMIGAAIAAQGVKGDGTEAALIGGMGLIQQQQINFTRDNEYEADRIGIHTDRKSVV